MVTSTKGLIGSIADRHTSENKKESCFYRESTLNESERRETCLRESFWSCVRKGETENCKVKVKVSRYRPGVAKRVPGS